MNGAYDHSDMLYDAAGAIVACRDMCGNEREALREWEDDNRKLSRLERNGVYLIAERIWRDSQIQAGVTVPVSPEERAAITRMTDRAP